MSEIKLNLTDAQRTISGPIHGSVADACVAALSAEPETIKELEAALARYHKPNGDKSPFAWFRMADDIDSEPWDAGIVIIDLAGRIIASESTYSRPSPEGEVQYHDGVCATDVSVSYRLPEDWLFVTSIEQYEFLRDRRRQERAEVPRLDAREVLYGRPLLEWIVSVSYATEAAANETPVVQTSLQSIHSTTDKDLLGQSATTETELHTPDPEDVWRKEISTLHARWLMTPRDDLQGQSVRDVLLAKQDIIDFDLHTRALQWSLQGEGPPCLATDSFAYRFAGFGTHEWVIYYDLVRYLLCKALSQQGSCHADSRQKEYLEQLAQFEKLKTEWLEHSQEEYDGRIPALLIENERIRLPIAMRGHDMVIDDDCPVCQMMANDSELGMEIGFWHLDGSHMEDDFVFSDLRTKEEWNGRQREWQEFTEKFNRESAQREHGGSPSGNGRTSRVCQMMSDEDDLMDSAQPIS
jgi:hypothetical protein